MGDSATPFGLVTPKKAKSVFGGAFGSSGATEKASDMSSSPFGIVPKADTKNTFSFAASNESKGSDTKTMKLDNLRTQVSSLCEEINTLDDLRDQIEKDVLFVIGSDGDVHEQLEYGREILRSFNDETLKRTLEEQPLDQRSKETWASLKDKLGEVEKCCAELDNHLSSSKIGADGAGAVTSAHLFRVLKQTYDSSKMQYNRVCKLAEHLEKLSMRGSRLGHTSGVSGISSVETDTHLRASKAEMVQVITETEQRSHDVRQHFLSLCNNVVTPRDVFSTPRHSTSDDIKKYLNGGPVPPKMGTSAATSKSPAPAEPAAKTGFGSFGVSNTPKDTTSKPSPFGASKATPFGAAPSAFSLGPAANSSSGFGGFGSTATIPNTGASPFGKPAVDYRQKLVEFYQKHNPEKLNSVDTTLQKYKGREEQLFQNLATKYKVNAAGGTSVPPASPAVQPTKPNAAASPFGQAGAFSAPSASSGAAFGSASSVGFGAVKPPSASPFGAAAQTFNGFGSSGGSAFGSTPTTPAFGSPSVFGAATGGFGAAAGGVDYRQKLTEFYQRHNPNKLNSVDATLEKYKGREDRLFAMLEQKYLGKPVSAAPATGGFGIPSTASFGGGSGFGAPSTLGGASPTPAFGSASSLGGAAQPAFGGASGFGTTSNIGSGFGPAAPAASGGAAAGSGFSSFGAQTSTFGAGQQQSGGFGAAVQQSGGFGGTANSGGFGSSFGSSQTGFGQQGAFNSASFTQMR
ncbi:hypothetical protein BBI17_007976 [Phytophthora kernoviae]|uniref:Uncharacterized protein n=1 Tax=Phytophthora kernoviae TaxID=325452 RepID=A0A421F3W1_9STRA|nr:hypothetical protein BBI17_007976 [Phytophthora kernoviae]